MKYYSCLSCHRRIEVLGNEQLLRCRCGEYEEHLLIEVDRKGNPIKRMMECDTCGDRYGDLSKKKCMSCKTNLKLVEVKE